MKDDNIHSKKTVYYLCKDGGIVTSKDLERAFYITTGLNASLNPREYSQYRDDCFGKSIHETIKPDVKLLLRKKGKFGAMLFYQEENNCSIRDARTAIEKIIIEEKERLGDRNCKNCKNYKNLLSSPDNKQCKDCKIDFLDCPSNWQSSQ